MGSRIDPRWLARLVGLLIVAAVIGGAVVFVLEESDQRGASGAALYSRGGYS